MMVVVIGRKKIAGRSGGDVLSIFGGVDAERAGHRPPFWRIALTLWPQNAVRYVGGIKS